MANLSPLHKDRLTYTPKLPGVLANNNMGISTQKGAPTESVADQKEVAALFPRTYGAPMVSFEKGTSSLQTKPINVGVILSGGQAPGGHNVISGLFDGMKKMNPDSKLFGFLGGPSGILENEAIEITEELLTEYRNSGGFDIIGSGRTKLESTEQFDTCIEVCKSRNITGIIIIGGDDSNTNAALLAEYFAQKETGIQVIGAPKTIDGDLKNEHIEISFGFDTACKTYSELIGNIQRDANSAKKYWHFIKLMGRSASHIGLECALQTQPNIAIISEEVEAKKMSLGDVVKGMTDIIESRAKAGETFGVALIPEGLVEFIPEVKVLIAELNDLMAHHEAEFAKLSTLEEQTSWLVGHLSSEAGNVFTSLPENIKKQLLLDRDPHGNVQVSLIETEKLLSEMINAELQARGSKPCKAQHHFFGYEGRCAFPSNFDADYCYSLGYNAFLLIASGLTGYLSSITNLSAPAAEWKAGGVPTTMMRTMEQRDGEKKPVIKKALVELDAAPFKKFAEMRDTWAKETSYTYPGAIQYYGPTEVCDQPTKTLALEQA